MFCSPRARLIIALVICLACEWASVKTGTYAVLMLFFVPGFLVGTIMFRSHGGLETLVLGWAGGTALLTAFFYALSNVIMWVVSRRSQRMPPS